MPRRRRRFTDEYKAEIVHLVETSKKPFRQICREHELVESVVRRWIHKAEAAEKMNASGDML